jgi:tryptophan-rich hypothetical protein
MKRQKYPHLLGSKWTAQETTFGWCHFQVVGRKQANNLVFAELVAACDPTVRFWLTAKSLKDRRCWQPGWKSLTGRRSAISSHNP